MGGSAASGLGNEVELKSIDLERLDGDRLLTGAGGDGSTTSSGGSTNVNPPRTVTNAVYTMSNVVLRDAATGGQTTPVNFGAGDIIDLAGTNRVEASGRLEVPIGVVSNFGSGGSAGAAVLDIQVTDDRGNRQRLSANVTFR